MKYPEEINVEILETNTAKLERLDHLKKRIKKLEIEVNSRRNDGWVEALIKAELQNLYITKRDLEKQL